MKNAGQPKPSTNHPPRF